MLEQVYFKICTRNLKLFYIYPSSLISKILAYGSNVKEKKMSKRSLKIIAIAEH